MLKRLAYDKEGGSVGGVQSDVLAVHIYYLQSHALNGGDSNGKGWLLVRLHAHLRPVLVTFLFNEVQMRDVYHPIDLNFELGSFATNAMLARGLVNAPQLTIFRAAYTLQSLTRVHISSLHDATMDVLAARRPRQERDPVTHIVQQVLAGRLPGQARRRARRPRARTQ